MTKDKSTNTFWYHATITREKRNGHKGIVVWLTGLSGSGKTTIAHTLEERLHDERVESFVLDGNNIRHGLYNMPMPVVAFNEDSSATGIGGNQRNDAEIISGAVYLY